MSENVKPDFSPQNPTSTSTRESMVKVAVEFLQNPRVKNTPVSRQKEFLYKKGLTEGEVELAIQKAGICEANNAVPFEQANPYTTHLGKGQLVMYRPPSVWTRINRMGSAIIILGIALYGLHKFYKLYIEPWLYGYQKQEDRLLQMEEQLVEVNRSLSQLRKSILSIEESVGLQKSQLPTDFGNPNINPDYFFNPVAVMEMRADITSIKSLLLNRHQFPDAPKISPSIPSWQLPMKSAQTAELEKTVDTTTQNKMITENAATEEETKTGLLSKCDKVQEHQCAVVQKRDAVDDGKNNEPKSRFHYGNEFNGNSETLDVFTEDDIIANSSVVKLNKVMKLSGKDIMDDCNNNNDNAQVIATVKSQIVTENASKNNVKEELEGHVNECSENRKCDITDPVVANGSFSEETHEEDVTVEEEKTVNPVSEDTSFSLS